MKLELILAKKRDVIMMGRALCPPLGLGVVAALTPNDVEVSLSDERISAIDFQKDTDLVGISALTTTAPRAYAIADTFRARGVKVVLGGVHPSLLPEEASCHADAVVIGEAEGIWSKVIDDFKAGTLEKFYTQEEPPNLVGWPLARRDLFAKSGYVVHSRAHFAQCLLSTAVDIASVPLTRSSRSLTALRAGGFYSSTMIIS
jgi:radical SAM superfamily enzyme YgiQ (UPF0313 family)